MSEMKMVGLPLSVTGPVDLGRLLRELETIDSLLVQSGLRKGDEAGQLPKLSIFMNQTVEMNKLDLRKESDRQALKAFLMEVRERAPRLHVSFSADPSEQFMTKFILWLRKSIHPEILITIGLQPNIGAGCMLRTTNKYFDFSLSQQLSKQRPLLMKKLQEHLTPESGQSNHEATSPNITPTKVEA